MRSVVLSIFGDPIPTVLLTLAQAVEKAIIEAEGSGSVERELKVRLKEVSERLNREFEKRLDAEYLHPRNCGGHFYTLLGEGTSDCDYCSCWMGACRSGGPEGVDAFGDCPGNPKLRDAYDMVKTKRENEK